jgi:hypothetical protein
MLVLEGEERRKNPLWGSGESYTDQNLSQFRIPEKWQLRPI